MPVKIIEAQSTEVLEKLVNDLLENNLLIVDPTFHYSTSSVGYYDQNTKDGDITSFYSVLISW